MFHKVTRELSYRNMRGRGTWPLASQINNIFNLVY